MFEGTGKYFLMLFAIFLIIEITIKICLSAIFKSAKVPGWKAYIPIYNRVVLTDLLDMKKSVFYKTLIPFANLYYYKIIIEELLKAYKLDPKDAIWFIITPMYKFPELVFASPRFMLHLYDNTEQFVVNEGNLYDEEKPHEINNFSNNLVQTPIDTPKSAPVNNSQVNNGQVPLANDNVFSNSNLEPDTRQETVVEAKQTVEEQKPIIFDKTKPKVCPNCGTKLSPTATVCFLCGTKIS
jgi:ribosomal protein L40E